MKLSWCPGQEESKETMHKLFCHGVIFATDSENSTDLQNDDISLRDAGNYQIYTNGAVRVEHGKITEVIRDVSKLSKSDLLGYDLVDLEGSMLLPGFIDIHVHGGGGHDFMEGSVEDIQEVCRFHATHGTTALLATTWTEERKWLEQAVATIAEVIGELPSGAQIVGIHLEGPFIHPARSGAQHPAHIREPSIEELASLIRLSRENIRLMTIAPERPLALETIRYAVQNGIRVAIGHSDATIEQVRLAMKAGATHVTHLFNGMRPFHHREPGVAGSALIFGGLTAELICDGYHVHPDAVGLVFRVKPMDELVLVTDAVAAAGMPDGEGYNLAGQACVKNAGRIVLASSGDLAGSCLTMDEALRNAMRFTGRNLADVLPTVTINPARQAGISHRKGSITPGKDADFVVLDDEYQVVSTYIKGQRV